MSLYSRRDKTSSRKTLDFLSEKRVTGTVADNDDVDPEVNRKVFKSSYTKLISQRHINSEEHDESNWLLSYSDMMTLLFGFFVLLMSFSKLDVEQFEKARKQTTQFFGGEYQIPYEKLKKEIMKEIAIKNGSDQVHIEADEKGIAITFRGALFFDAGEAVMKPEAQALLENIVPVIKNQNKSFLILIEGHTDDDPISDSRFPSNWELSAFLASNVLHFFERAGFGKERLKAVGLGETQPIVPNRDEKGEPIKVNQAQNRRVVIRLVRSEI